MLLHEVFHLYPIPIIKEKKYLLNIETADSKILEFFLKSFELGYLSPPYESDANYYTDPRTHIDGKTPIYSFDLKLIFFKFLNVPTGENEKKVKKNNEILSKNVVSVLKDGKSQYPKLAHRFQMQQKCSTCQEYGINSEDLGKTIELLEER